MLKRILSLILNIIGSGIIVGTIVLALSWFLEIEVISKLMDVNFYKSLLYSTKNIHISSHSISSFFYALGGFASNGIIYTIIFLGIVLDFAKNKLNFKVSFLKKMIILNSFLFIIYSIYAYFENPIIYLLFIVSIIATLIGIAFEVLADTFIDNNNNSR